MSLLKKIQEKKSALLLLTLLPIALIALFPRFRTWRGAAYYANNIDPHYAYLLSSAAVATGHSPPHWDHPGLPLQALGGAIIRLSTSPSNRIQEVIDNPERFVDRIAEALMVLNAILLFSAGLIIFSVFGRISCAVIFQAVPLLGFQSWIAAETLWPDFLATTLALNLFAVLLKAGFKPATKKGFVWVPLGVALLLVTKLTCLPALVAPAYEARKDLWRAIKIFSLSVVFYLLFLFAAFGLHIRPFIHHTKELLLNRSGVKSAPLEALHRSIINIKEAVPDAPSYFIVFAISLVLAGYVYYRSRKNRRQPQRLGEATGKVLPFLLLMIAVSALQIGFASRIYTFRYLLPGFASLSMAIALGAYALLPKKLDWLCSASFVTLALFFPASLFFDSDFIKDRNLDLAQAEEALNSASCKVFSAYDSSVPYALNFSNAFSGHIFARELRNKYPDFLAYDGKGEFFDYLRNSIPLKEALSGLPGDTRICLRGVDRYMGPVMSGRTLKPLYKSRYNGDSAWFAGTVKELLSSQ